MFSYILRRLIYAVPTVIGVMLLIFILFFFVNPPEKMARRMIGEKNSTPEAIEDWKREHGYNYPILINSEKKGLEVITQTIFFQKALPLLWFDFGKSDLNNEDIGKQIRDRMGPSLSYTVPNLIIGLWVCLTFSMVVAYLRGTYFDLGALIMCVTIMSIPGLLYIIGGQWIFGNHLRLVPVSGYDSGWNALRFVILPIGLAIIGAFGRGVRFNRIIFLEEINRDYIRTARSKGLTESEVLFGHGLRNALIPILTSTVASIPFLFYGGLITEQFFGIPGLGDFMITAINAQDFSIVRSMVYIGAILTIIGYIMTDISYCIADPRIRLE